MMRAVRPVAAIAAAVAALLVSAASGPAAQAMTTAQILQGFDPGDIISDQVMFNPSTMSAGAVQSFLNGMVPSCRSGYTCLKDYHQTTRTIGADPMCSTYHGASNESAATIITKVARACDVNPQVLLVTLQKEQGLVTDSWPDPSEYRKATGYGCPDSQDYCDAVFNGFFNQVYKAAWAFRRYTTPPGTTGAGWTSFSWIPIGQPYGAPVNPNVAVCGSESIVVRNKATASLYYYTPYVPNSAALAAGFGLGNGCSSYGNRNFYLYFTTWFGSTHYTATGSIGSYWTKHGGAKGALGAIQANARPVKSSDGSTGRAQTFVNGTVYSSSKGTYAVLGASRTAFNAAGGSTGVLGWPTADQGVTSARSGGIVQSFAGGGLYLGPAGTFTVTGSIAAAYRAANGPAGALGWPTGRAAPVAASSAGTAGGGASQAFQTGTIAGANGKAAHILTGVLLTTWTAQRAALGWPVEDQAAVQGRNAPGTRQRFTTGGLYGTPAGVVTVSGALYSAFESHSDVTGRLGYPVSAAAASTANGGGSAQTFAGGIEYSSAAGVHTLTGSALKEYLRRGGVNGTLGWPTADRVAQTAKPKGGYWTFQSGRLYSSKITTVAVRGMILALYSAKDGAEGVLGWPTGTAHTHKGVTTQLFQHGSITFTPAGGAVLHH